MKAEIKKREEVASETLLVVFDLLGKNVEFKPGQFFFVELIDPPYKDEKGGRHFSFVNSPREKGVITMATRLRDSAFKRSLAEMPLGSEVVIVDGGGDFTLPDEGEKPLVLVAGGIGIAPFISMTRYVIEAGLDYHISLLYSNRDRQSAAFLEELEDRAKNNEHLELILTMTDDPAWEGETRKIDREFISDYVEDPGSNTFFVAGPPAMNKAVLSELVKFGIGKEDVKVSDFAGY
ncbi:MAG: hypothetical protein A2W01_08550 [Candidatus Solincola sediminis]|uniref:FAD-binding FR-type domain-containing protein n=1 Tax=Candidatus Solincola sediminis TaxID=1797199 RepID=A0A1F2WNA5_9ACTN|nr:MAG: hypothetical protein A2Y75_01855 [Candidatus Solincola sediminis]OFW60187.1 MAG: hypothetical protein A2W01_08550 [Candidatus Solincola sediminis]